MTTNTKAKQPRATSYGPRPSTPTPWKIIKPYLGISKSAIKGEIHTVAHHVFNNDAAFIVRAVNAHEALVSCVRSALAYMHDDYVGESIDLEKAIAEALKLAEENNQ